MKNKKTDHRREYEKIWARRKRRERYKIIDKIKLDSGCIDCGYNKHSAALDFDHVDPTKKEFEISKVIGTKNLKIIFEEIDKCEIRCSNCHRIKTHRDRYGGYESNLELPYVGFAIGSRIASAKLTENQVMEIKSRICSSESVLKIANDYGVSRATIQSIKSGRTWRHINV